MEQDPYKLINDIHDRIADDDSEQLILSDYEPNPTVWGYSKWWLFLVGSPALVTLFVTAQFLTGTSKLYGFGATVVLVVFAGLATWASPSDMDARGYFTAIVSHHGHQKEMIHDTDPDETRLEQPKNDSWLGRFARLPFVRDWPIVGAGEYEPTQALVAHKKPFRDGYAILRDDGSLIGAIRILPIPLRLESEEAKRKANRAFANALETAVDYDAELFTPTRVADFESRRKQWEDRTRAYQSQADRLMSAADVDAAIDAIRKQILADISDELAAGINLYEDTKRMKEHYILVSVDPDEVIIDRSAESGGLGSITGLGELVKLKRLREQAGTDEHINRLVEKLERRVENLESELNRIDDLSANAKSAIEFSEAIADFYRGTNVRAHDDFTQCIRGSPVPGGTDAGDPEHDVSYQHIANRTRAGSPASSPTTVHAADGGVATADRSAEQSGGDTTASAQAPASPAEPVVDDEIEDGDKDGGESVPATVLNQDTLVGLAEDEEELSWRYKTALAPHTHERHATSCELDDEYHTRTLEVTDWPGVPVHGFFDPLVSFQMPKVDMTISTHITGEDSQKAAREIAEDANSLKDKVRRLAENKWIPDVFVREAGGEYGDVKRTQNTVEASEYGLYTSHTYIEIRAPDQDKLDTAQTKIRSRMQEVSADAKPLKYQHRLGYQTVAPACKNYLGGNTKMTGKGLARLMPWTAENLIEPGGIELGTNEDTGDPLILDLQNRETGFNVGVWGTIGSGKTTTLTRLLMRLKMKNPEIPLVIIDPKQEYAGLTWLFDGETVTIGSDTGINPLQIEETPPEKLDGEGDEGPYRNAVRRAMDFVRSFYEYQDLPFEDVQDTWRDAITEAYRRRGISKNPTTHSKDSPTLKDDVFPIFVEMVHSPENFVHSALTDVETSVDGMRQRADNILHQHTGALQEGGEFEHLSMETDIDIQNIDVLYLDLQNYENEVSAGLMMGPVLTAVLEQAKEIDEPMALAMDEFHYMLQNSSSLETLKQAYRHSRHSDLSMITGTQSVEEFFTKNDEGERQLTEDASTLTNLMSVKIWHYLEEMDDEWAGEFDMTDAEQGHIEDADTGDPTAQALLQLQKGGSYRLDVDYTDKLTPREFAMNQYDPTDHGTKPLTYLDNYTDGKGRDATEWTWIDPEEIVTPSPDDSDQSDAPDVVDTTTTTADIADVEVIPSDDVDGFDPSAAEDGDGGRNGSGDGKGSEDGEDERNADGSPEEDDDSPVLTDIGTVSVRTADDLRSAGFETIEEVVVADGTALAEVGGFDEQKAGFIQDQAAEALGMSPDEIESEPGDVETESGVKMETETGGESATAKHEQNGDGEQDSDDESDGLLGRIVSSVSPSHPAAGKSDPDVEIIGPVDAQKAAALRAAGYETAVDVCKADTSALTAVEGIDETKAGYLKRMAEKTIEISDASLPSTDATGSEQEPDAPDEREVDTPDENGTETPENSDQSAEDPQSPESPSDAEAADADDAAPESNGDEPASPALTDIQEVGGGRADVLREAGFETAEDMATANESSLTDIEGIGDARAETIVESAISLVDEQPEMPAAAAGGDD
jgi:Cdc6-like AAA superfamily ATPase